MNTFENNEDLPFSSVDAEVKQALASSRRDNFAPGFEDRVLARWNRERTVTPNTFTFIERRAWQLLPLAIAASLMLAAYSAQHNSAPSMSLVARTLGWKQPVAVASANTSQRQTYESVYSTLYGLPLTSSASGVQ